MSNCTRNIIRNAIKGDNEVRNIFIAPSTNIFEYILSRYTKYKYFTIKNNIEMQHANLQYLSADIAQWPVYLDLDLIICNDIVQQLDLCTQYSRRFHIPLIIIHHQPANSFIKKEDMYILLQNNQQNTRISIDENINKSWYANFPIIPYGLPELNQSFSIKNKALLMCDIIPDMAPSVQALKQKLGDKLTVINLRDAYKLNDLFQIIQEHEIFINIAKQEYIDIFMLIAMACGKTILSHAISKDIIKDGENGYIINNLEQIVKHVNGSPPKFIGSNATYTIRSEFPINNFTSSWETLIDTLTHKAFI